ncbi:MAG: hypothetical protein LBN07_03270 [Christensenellaceae bacterium]|nr:hypothetical protein [Christensenellaceae bacterium]
MAQVAERFKRKLGKLQEELENMPYPEYEDKDNPDFNLFNHFYHGGHLLNEMKNGCFITEEIINGGYPCLRKKLLDSVCSFAAERYFQREIYYDLAELFEIKFKAFQDDGLDERFEHVLQGDIANAQSIDLNVVLELNNFGRAVGNMLKTSDNPQVIETHKDLLRYLPEQTQIDIMQNYVSGACELYKDLCDYKMPSPEHFIKDFILNLFDKNEEGKYTPIASDIAIGALLGHLKRNDFIHGKEFGMYREVVGMLNHWYYNGEGHIEDFVKMVPPPNVKPLEAFEFIE